MGSGKKILAVCDPELEYGIRLASYMRKKKGLHFIYHTFTGVEALRDFLSRGKIDFFLISESLLEDKAFLKDLPSKKILILTEERRKEWPGYNCCFRYQSCENLIREILGIWGGESYEEGAVWAGRKMKKYAVYSPVGRTAKTSFALTLGQILAKEESVLYVNLEEYAGFEELLGCSLDRGIGDLLYFMRQQKETLPLKISSMIANLGNLDYLPPAISPLDISRAEGEDWLQFFACLAKYTSYDALVIDAGDGICNLFEVLDQCDRVFMPVREDSVSKAKQSQFEKLVDMTDFRSLKEKIRKIQPPFHRSSKKGREYLDELVWSELGDFVRETLRSEVRGKSS